MPDSRPRRLRSARDTIAAVAISVVLGSAMWLFARGEVETDRPIDAAFVVSVDPPNVVHPARSVVTLIVRGPRAAVESIKDVQGSYHVPATETETKFKLPLDASYFSLPPDVHITSFRPTGIEIDVSHIVSRTLPVRLRLSGQAEVDPGFFVDENACSVSPSEVLVRGPRSILESPDLSAVPTEPVSVAFRSASFTTPSEIALDPESIGPGVSTSERVTAHIVIKPQEDSRAFDECPVMILLPPNAPFLPIISTPTVSVKVSGPPKVLARLKREEILVYARVDSQARTPFTVNCRVEVPPDRNLSVLGPTPRVTVDRLLEITLPTRESSPSP